MNTNLLSCAKHAWAIVIFFTVFMAIMTYNLIVFPACAIDTMQFFQVGQSELTILTSVTSVVGVFAGILFGPMLDQKDVRKSIMLFLTIGVVLFFIRAFLMSYPLVLSVTFFASFCVGICQVAGPKVVGTWFPAEKVGFATSFLTAGAGIGSAASFAIGAILNLRSALLSIAIAYLILLFYWIVVGKEGPYKITVSTEVQIEPQASATVYKSKSLWLLIIAYSLAVTCGLLLNSYMINAFISKGLGANQASVMATVMNLALMFGGFIMTAILGAVKRFNILTAISMLGSAVFILIGWFLPLGPITWFCVTASGLIFGGCLGLYVGRIPLIPMTGQFAPENIGSAMGITESIKGIVSFILPIAVATLFGTNFTGIFIVYALCCVISVFFGNVLVPELGEKGKLFQKTQHPS